MLDVMCAEMEALTRRVPGEQLERAKAMATSLVCNTLESKAASTEDLGRQYLTYGQRISLREYLRMIGELGPGEVAGFVGRLLDTPPSLAAFGAGCGGIRYEGLAARYGRGAGGGSAAAAGSGGVLDQLQSLVGGGGR
jgi:processing peptidase subunit alpha